MGPQGAAADTGWLRLPSLAKASVEETLVFPQTEGGVYRGPVSWPEE